jgi:hypothetical protein
MNDQEAGLAWSGDVRSAIEAFRTLDPKRLVYGAFDLVWDLRQTHARLQKLAGD